MINKRILPYILIFGIIIVFSLVAFLLLNIELSTINVWALIFILISEVVAFIILTYLRTSENSCNTIFIKSGITVSASLYCIATLVCSVLAIVFMSNLNLFILIQIALMSLFAIIMIIMFSFATKVYQRNVEYTVKKDITEPKRGGV